MREKFVAYYQPTGQEFSELWEKCLFVIDTNVLLNLYRFPEQARNDFLTEGYTSISLFSVYRFSQLDCLTPIG